MSGPSCVRAPDACGAFELPFAPDRVDEMVAQLAAAAGAVRGIGLAIGLAHLHVKQVKLPPVAHGARRQMLTVEPERWFAVPQGAPTAVSLTAAGDIALGADGGTGRRLRPRLRPLEHCAPRRSSSDGIGAGTRRGRPCHNHCGARRRHR
ncbi:MAG: hypothetical protein U5K74_06890 [Gemmatimonadaceae bacterium]|nr:hypothetical protein [Gemmatimonadaceae bacterium]